MRFESFTIENFKGIQKATIDVDAPDPKVFSLGFVDKGYPEFD